MAALAFGFTQGEQPVLRSLSQGDSNRIGALSDQVKRLEEGGVDHGSTLGLNVRPAGRVKAVDSNRITGDTGCTRDPR